MARSPRVVEPAAAVAHDDGWTALRWPRTGADLHELVALRIPLRLAPGEAYVREGWQSWSTPTLERLGAGVRRAPASTPPRFGRRHWLADPPYAGDESYNIWRSASATAYVEPGAGAVFVAGDDGLLVVREEPAGGGHPDVWLRRSAVGEDELRDRVGPPPRPVAAHTGWTTWDSHGPELRGDDLLDDLDAIERRLGDTVEVVNVDDGWQRAIGDWWPRDPLMAHALAAVADRRRLALWWAPFVVHRDADLVAEHPGWLLRDRDGAPVVVLARDWPWEAWALDLTHPDVLGWLAETAQRLAGWGAGLLKCDFLYASAFAVDAARAGACADPSRTGEEAHRDALAAIRSAGVDLIGCGAPLWPSAGLVDLMRVGPDTGRRWWKPVPAELEPEHGAGCLANAWAAGHRRQWMDRALWVNDPDSIFVTAGPQGDTWLAWVAAHGLPLVLGDPLAVLDTERVRRWEVAVDEWRAATATCDA